MSATRVAVVTGSNKGIGFAIVESLCQKLDSDWAVYLTARDVSRGEKAVKDLEGQGLKPRFHQLDICCQKSLNDMAKYLKEKYGGLDLLVNNAGIAYKHNSTAPVAEQAEVTMRTNFTATLDACNTFFPLLRPHARVVNVSSFVSTRSLEQCSGELRKKLTSQLTMKELKGLMAKYVQDAKDDKIEQNGWPNTCYGTSKMGVTAMTKIQQRDFDKDSREDLIVNACCPGYVNTDMTSHKGPLTIQQGAANPVYVALIPKNATEPKGEFVSKLKVVNWE